MGWGWWGRWRCVVARHQNPYCFRGDNNTRYVLRIPKIFIFFPRGKEWVVCATYTKHISRHTDSNQTKCFLHIRGEETPLSCNPSTKCKSHGHSPLVPRHYLRPTSLPRLRLGSSLVTSVLLRVHVFPFPQRATYVWWRAAPSVRTLLIVQEGCRFS